MLVGGEVVLRPSVVDEGEDDDDEEDHVALCRVRT